MKTHSTRSWLTGALLVAWLTIGSGCVATSWPPPQSSRPSPPTEAPPPRPVQVVEAPPPPPPAPIAADHVVFYSEPNFRGESFIVEAGAAVEDLARLRREHGSWSNSIASFRIEGAATVVAYTDAEFRGARLESSRSVADLDAERRRDGPATSWDHAISSIRVLSPHVVVYEAPPPPPPPRYDRRTAEVIVQRAYRDLLDRKVDPEGLRVYREKLIERNWTEDELRRDLRNSPEFRALNPDEVITRAYHDVLKREPDPAGLNHYRDLFANHGWTIGQIRADLVRSPEWTEKRIHDVITKAYRDILGRDPDAAGLENYRRAIRDKAWNEQQIRADLARSAEAQQKRVAEQNRH
jgi:hypothetical protein